MAAGIVAVGPGPLPFCMTKGHGKPELWKGRTSGQAFFFNYNDDGEIITATPEGGRIE